MSFHLTIKRVSRYYCFFKVRVWIGNDKGLLRLATANLLFGLTFLGFNFISYKISGLD